MKLPVSLFTQGTIVRVEYPFQEDKSKIKKRPAVVMSYDKDVTHVVLLKVTSHAPRTSYDYTIQEYRGTGLDKQPSVVRCNCVYTISNTENLQKLGNLSRKDLITVTLLYRQALSQKEVEHFKS